MPLDKLADGYQLFRIHFQGRNFSRAWWPCVLPISFYSSDRIQSVVHNKEIKADCKFCWKHKLQHSRSIIALFNPHKRILKKFAAISYLDTDPILWMLAECGCGCATGVSDRHDASIFRVGKCTSETNKRGNWAGNMSGSIGPVLRKTTLDRTTDFCLLQTTGLECELGPLCGWGSILMGGRNVSSETWGKQTTFTRCEYFRTG